VKKYSQVHGSAMGASAAAGELVQSDMPADRAKYYSPAQIAEMYGVGVQRVLGWIRSGELVAMCVSVSSKSQKPQFRVSADALDQFQRARTATPFRPVRRPNYRRII